MAEEFIRDGDNDEGAPAIGNNPAQESDDAPEQAEEPEVLAHSDDDPGRRWYIGWVASPQGEGNPSVP
jgi:hypothetical protein